MFSSNELCYGIVFNHVSGGCYFKNQDVFNTIAVVNDSTSTAVALNVNTSMSSACSYTNGSTYVAPSGQSFTVGCNMDMEPIDDFCPTTSPTFESTAATGNITPGTCPSHAESLADCIAQCSAGNPACAGVVYYPQLSTGYTSCWFKSSMPPGAFFTSNDTHLAIAHYPSASIINSSCTNQSTYISPIKASDNFLITCNTNAAGRTDIGKLFAQNITACCDACSNWNDTAVGSCQAISFDTTLTGGYENCYLKHVNASFQFVQVTGTHSAILQLELSPAPPIEPSSTPAKGSQKKNNDAKVYGPIIGIIGTGAIAAGFFWWRFRFGKRRQKGAHPQLPGNITEAHPSANHAEALNSRWEVDGTDVRAEADAINGAYAEMDVLDAARAEMDVPDAARAEME